MELDIKKAFCSPFSEDKWYLKLIFPFIICATFIVFNSNLHIIRLVPIIAAFFLAVPYLILWGYFIKFQHNEINNHLPLLPEFKNIKDYLSYGLRLTGISLIYIAIGLVFLIATVFLFKIGSFMKIVSVFMFTAIVLFLWIALIFSVSSYADKFCFNDAVNFKRVLRLMSKVRLEILVWLLLVVLLGLVLRVISMFPAFLLAIYPFARTFIKLILNNLNAQLYKVAKSRL